MRNTSCQYRYQTTPARTIAAFDEPSQSEDRHRQSARPGKGRDHRGVHSDPARYWRSCRTWVWTPVMPSSRSMDAMISGREGSRGTAAHASSGARRMVGRLIAAESGPPSPLIPGCRQLRRANGSKKLTLARALTHHSALADPMSARLASESGLPYLHGMTAADGEEADEQPGQSESGQNPRAPSRWRYQGPQSRL